MMNYVWLGEFDQGREMAGTIDLGLKDDFGNAYMTDINCPDSPQPEIVEWTDDETDLVYWRIYLRTSAISQAGTFGFCVRSDKASTVPTTYVFYVKGTK